MAEEKGKVVLFGKRWSGTETVAKMLVRGELKDSYLEPTDSNSECETYVGRGWTVIDTMGFGEPLGGIVPDEYVRKMAIDFLNEVKGRYSHIIFVVNRGDFTLHRKDVNLLGIPFMWRTFLETFKGGEENFVVLVNNETPVHQRQMKGQNEVAARIEKIFPECKHFLYTDFGNPDPAKFRNDSHAASRIEALTRFEREMEEMFTATNCSWAEPKIAKMGDAEIKQTAAKISRHLTSSPAIQPREWGRWRGSVYEEIFSAMRMPQSDLQRLQWRASMVSSARDEMQNLGKAVKFFPRQCEYLLQRSMEVSTELQDLVNGTVEAISDDDDHRHLAPLLNSLHRLDTHTEAAKELLELCGDTEKEHEVALTLSSRPIPGTTNSRVSKFDLVIRHLDWSLDVFRFLSQNPEAQRASSESERQSWLSKFLWCESRGRLVYVGDGEDKSIADAASEDKDVVHSSNVAADTDRQAQDQLDLVSAMESHFTTFQNPNKAVSSFSISRLFISPVDPRVEKLSSSEIVSFMSILRNRLHGDASFDGGSSIKTVPDCFRIPGKQDYKAAQLIGKGSYKKVHKCIWLGMEVAVATESQCYDQSDQRGDDSMTVLEAEAGLLARVQHPNVVTFIGYGYDEENRRGFQVSELMESSLRTLINKGYRSNASCFPFSVCESIDILLQIAEAMIHVHECGVIYLDLKAENCLANRKLDDLGLVVDVVKLTDFGTSELQSPEMGCHFKTPNKGSRPWMAPELYQWPGEEVKLYTWSADVYSFGMTCYEVVTGEVPFGIFSRWLGEAVRKGLRPPIPDNCPDEFRELMEKCWAHSPEDRPTFKEIREILWRCKLYHTIFHAEPNGKFAPKANEWKKVFCGLW